MAPQIQDGLLLVPNWRPKGQGIWVSYKPEVANPHEYKKADLQVYTRMAEERGLKVVTASIRNRLDNFEHKGLVYDGNLRYMREMRRSMANNPSELLGTVVKKTETETETETEIGWLIADNVIASDFKPNGKVQNKRFRPLGYPLEDMEIHYIDPKTGVARRMRAEGDDCECRQYHEAWQHIDERMNDGDEHAVLRPSYDQARHEVQNIIWIRDPPEWEKRNPLENPGARFYRFETHQEFRERRTNPQTPSVPE